MISMLSICFSLLFFLMIRRPPRSTLFPYRRSSDLTGGVGSARAAEDLSVSGRHGAGGARVGAEGAGRGCEVGEVDPGTDGSGGQERAAAAAGCGQAVRDAD